jgi:hypothetical protein
MKTILGKSFALAVFTLGLFFAPQYLRVSSDASASPAEGCWIRGYSIPNSSPPQCGCIAFDINPQGDEEDLPDVDLGGAPNCTAVCQYTYPTVCNPD